MVKTQAYSYTDIRGDWAKAMPFCYLFSVPSFFTKTCTAV